MVNSLNQSQVKVKEDMFYKFQPRTGEIICQWIHYAVKTTFSNGGDINKSKSVQQRLIIVVKTMYNRQLCKTKLLKLNFGLFCSKNKHFKIVL